MNDFQTKIVGEATETNGVVPSKTANKTQKMSGFIPKSAAVLLSKTIAADLKKARDIVQLDEFVLREKDNLLELINLGFSVDDVVLKLRDGGFDGATKAKVRLLLNLKQKK